MEAYNVPESSFYNVLAGRRQTTRVCEAFRQEMIKKINESPNASVTVELKNDESDLVNDPYASNSMIHSPKTPRSPKSPKRKRKRASGDLCLDDREFLLYTDISPRRKKARISSQFTPQSPMDIDDEYNNAAVSRRRATTSRRSLFGPKSCSSQNSQPDFEQCEEILTATVSSPAAAMDFRKKTVEPMITSDEESSSDDECFLSEAKRDEIRQLVNNFKKREMDKILSYKASGCAVDVLMAADATLEDLQEQFACAPRKNKRKNQPSRALLF